MESGIKPNKLGSWFTRKLQYSQAPQGTATSSAEGTNPQAISEQAGRISFPISPGDNQRSSRIIEVRNKTVGEIPLLGACAVEAKMAQREVLLLQRMCSRSQDGNHRVEMPCLGQRIRLDKGMRPRKGLDRGRAQQSWAWWGQAQAWCPKNWTSPTVRQSWATCLWMSHRALGDSPFAPINFTTTPHPPMHGSLNCFSHDCGRTLFPLATVLGLV